MKKVFISVPMKGRTKENIEKSIEKMKKVAAAYLDEDVEFVNTVVQDRPPYELDKEHTSVWYLGESIKILSQCDVMVGLYRIWDYKGCYIEREVAERYGIETILLDIDYICPDIPDEDIEATNESR